MKKTLPFDPWKRCAGHLAEWSLPAFIDTYLNTEKTLIEARVAKGAVRNVRARTAAQTAALYALLNAYHANLVEAAVYGFDGVSVSLNKADLCKAPTRYNRLVKDVEREQFITVTEVLEKAKAIRVVKGEKGTWLVTVYDWETGTTSQRPRMRTRVNLTKSYLETLRQTMLGKRAKWSEANTGSWFERLEGEEVVLVRDDDTEELVDYPDNPVADAWRLKVKRYNNAVNAADICHPEHDGGARIVLQARFVEAPAGQPWDSLGGRLYGTNSFTTPFWYAMSGEKKLAMTIDGSPVVCLDFKAFAPTLAHHMRGIEVASDPYLAVPGFSRDEVKTVFNAMLSAKPRRDGSHEFKGAFKDKGDGVTLPLDKLNAIVAAVEIAHPLLHDAFFAGGWKTLQNREVKIVFGAALELLDKGIVACVMHDALYVTIDHESEALAALHAKYREVTGYAPLMVTTETKVDRYKRARDHG